jgi:hypothetical protein
MAAKKKVFDCVEFKHKLHRDTFKKSGAKTLSEYISYVNFEVEKSPLHKKVNTQNV